jgi:branched-chain amino acid transport system permease protein
MRRDRTLVVLGAAAAAFAVAGPFLPPWLQFLLAVSVAKGLVVLGLLLLLRAGLVSFGQALFYCVGAYAAGGMGRFYGVTDVLGLAAGGALAAGVVAFVLGFLLARYRGIFFGLLSLALSMIFYGLLVKSEALGSTDGFNLLPFTVFGKRPADGYVPLALLFAACALAVVGVLLVHRYTNTPLGRLAPAIRDNEIRVEYMGASVRRAIHVKYVIAAVLAGAGGGLIAAAVGHIDPELGYWTTSGEFIFISVLAGTGSVLAPFLGSIIFEGIRSFAFDLSPNTWQMVLGTALLLVIVFLPEGLWSLFARRRGA